MNRPPLIRRPIFLHRPFFNPTLLIAPKSYRLHFAFDARCPRPERLIKLTLSLFSVFGGMTTERHMKKLLFPTVTFTGLLAASLQAGQEVSQAGRTAAAATNVWTRLLWCDRRRGRTCIKTAADDKNFHEDNSNLDILVFIFPSSLEVNPKMTSASLGGVKLGYVFGSGVVRPTVEGDFFYNGFRGGANFTLRDSFDNVVAQRNATTWINTGAFMANFILRFAAGNQRFQPYAGAGVGIYYAESAGVEVGRSRNW